MKELSRQKIINLLKENGFSLKDLNNKIKDDKDVVMAAVKKNGWAIEFASKRLQDDEEVAIEALEQSSNYTPEYGW